MDDAPDPGIAIADPLVRKLRRQQRLLRGIALVNLLLAALFLGVLREKFGYGAIIAAVALGAMGLAALSTAARIANALRNW